MALLKTPKDQSKPNAKPTTTRPSTFASLRTVPPQLSPHLPFMETRPKRSQLGMRLDSVMTDRPALDIASENQAKAA